MSEQETLHSLTNLFREIFKDAQLVLTESTTAADVSGWDSLTHMQIVSQVESTYGIKLKLTEIMRLKNVGDLCQIIDGHLGRKQ